MVVKDIFGSERDEFNKIVSHPLQSWEWGEFRKKTGVGVIRRGVLQDNKLIDGYLLTLHQIPHTPWKIGYLPKGEFPTQQILEDLVQVGQTNNCIFIKLEPNVKKSKVKSQKSKVQIKSKKYRFVHSQHPLFTKYTFQIDLTKSEHELLRQMKPKTRYNVQLARRKGVEIVKDNSPAAFGEYLHLLKETTKRQKFYAHSEDYHRKLWEVLHPAGIAHLLKAVYRGETLVVWILFLFKHVLYYPYGASSIAYKEVMASNLIVWEAMRWGKQNGATLFDLWGALGSHPEPKDPWYGFHRFKQGYGGELVEFVGSYDLVLRPVVYHIYNILYILRWRILSLLSRI